MAHMKKKLSRIEKALKELMDKPAFYSNDWLETEEVNSRLRSSSAISEKVIKSINEKQFEGSSSSNQSNHEDTSLMNNTKQILSPPKKVITKRKKKSDSDFDDQNRIMRKTSQKIPKPGRNVGDNKQIENRSLRTKKIKYKFRNKSNKSPSKEIFNEELKMDSFQISNNNSVNDETNSVSDEIQYFVTKSKDSSMNIGQSSVNNIEPGKNIIGKESANSSMRNIPSNIGPLQSPVSQIFVSNLGQQKTDRRKDSKVDSLKRASNWQFNSIHDKLKSLHSSIKYNNKLIREKEKDINSFKLQLKVQSKSTKNYYESINELKERVTNLEKDLKNKELQQNFPKVSPKQIEALKIELLEDIGKVRADLQKEEKENFKRIVTLEANYHDQKKNISLMMSKLGEEKLQEKLKSDQEFQLNKYLKEIEFLKKDFFVVKTKLTEKFENLNAVFEECKSPLDQQIKRL